MPTTPPSRDNGLEQLELRGPVGQRQGAEDATFCETAAMIIASLRGHDDAEEVRAELGCCSGAECKIENMAIFHAMDR